MLDKSLSIRLDVLHNHGKKSAYVEAIQLLRTHPVERALELLREKLEVCEDKEMSLDRKLEVTILPLHSKGL